MVPNSLPVSLGSVITEFGGTNPPRNLGAYRAGAGYTPAGTKGGSAAIPVANGAIPSSFPVNLGAFPGAKKELSVTAYWPYKDYFHRNFYNWNNNPPQTTSNNNDATSNLNSAHNAGYISASQVGWQRKVFNNANNAALPDSGTCTVFFLYAGSYASYSNVYSGGTGLSVRANDPTGVEMHMSAIATGRLQFQTQNTGTQSETSLSWASFNCSIKKIVEVINCFYPNGSNTATDEILIVPGIKTIGSYFVKRDGTGGTDIKPSSPINPDEICFGMRYDGAGDHQILYTNQTFPNWLRQSNWWYNNVGMDIEANCGTSPTYLTTTVPMDDDPSHVWAVVVDNTAVTYPVGVNTAWTTLVLSSTGQSSISLNRNGSMSSTIGTVNYDLPTYPGCAENWYMGNTMTTMPGDNYWANVTMQSGSDGLTGPTGWVQLNANRTWTGPGNGTNCVVNIDIADNPAGTNPKRLGYAILSVASSGGGGGGGCVEVSSYLPDGKQAINVAVGDVLQLADHESIELGTGEVSYSQTKVLPGYRIQTESGIALRCSDSAPIATDTGDYCLPPDLLGKKVATRVDVDGGILTKWETVVLVESIGDIAVQHITVGDKNFWAGEQQGAYILHHNLKNNPGSNEAL